MEAHLRLLGFVQSKPQMLFNMEFAERTWYHPPSGYVVSDAKRDNFIQDAKGNIHVIDLMVQHAPPGGKLEQLMQYSLPRIRQEGEDGKEPQAADGSTLNPPRLRR